MGVHCLIPPHAVLNVRHFDVFVMIHFWGLASKRDTNLGVFDGVWLVFERRGYSIDRAVAARRVVEPLDVIEDGKPSVVGLTESTDQDQGRS